MKSWKNRTLTSLVSWDLVVVQHNSSLSWSSVTTLTHVFIVQIFGEFIIAWYCAKV